MTHVTTVQNWDILKENVKNTQKLKENLIKKGTMETSENTNDCYPRLRYRSRETYETLMKSEIEK